MTQQYYAAYSAEQSLDDDHIHVYRGLGDENMPELKGSIKGSNVASFLQKISLGSRAKSQQGVDHASLIEDDVKTNMEMDNAGMCLSEVGDDQIKSCTTEV